MTVLKRIKGSADFLYETAELFNNLNRTFAGNLNGPNPRTIIFCKIAVVVVKICLEKAIIGKAWHCGSWERRTGVVWCRSGLRLRQLSYYVDRRLLGLMAGTSDQYPMTRPWLRYREKVIIDRYWLSFPSLRPHHVNGEGDNRISMVSVLPFEVKSQSTQMGRFRILDSASPFLPYSEKFMSFEQHWLLAWHLQPLAIQQGQVTFAPWRRFIANIH